MPQNRDNIQPNSPETAANARNEPRAAIIGERPLNELVPLEHMPISAPVPGTSRYEQFYNDVVASYHLRGLGGLGFDQNSTQIELVDPIVTRLLYAVRSGKLLRRPEPGDDPQTQRPSIYENFIREMPLFTGWRLYGQYLRGKSPHVIANPVLRIPEKHAAIDPHGHFRKGWLPAGRGEAVKDADIRVRRYIFHDGDPRDRAPSGAATDEGFAASQSMLARLVQFYSPFWNSIWGGSSGGGCWLQLLAEDRPPSDATKEFDRMLLACAEAAAGSHDCSLDMKTVNASRLMGLVGTKNLKGDDPALHRTRTWSVNQAIAIQPANSELLTEHCRESTPEVFENHWRLYQTALRREGAPTTVRTAVNLPKADLTEEVKRAIAYAKTCQPAINGQGGSAITIGMAAKIIHRLSLNRSSLLKAMGIWNAGLATPWSTKELEHKVDDAIKRAGVDPEGWIASNPLPNRRQGPTLPRDYRMDFGGIGVDEFDEEKPNESPDDPDRLARLFLESRTTQDGVPTIGYWNSMWPLWDHEEGVYAISTEKDLRPSIHRFTKKEADRVNIDAIARVREWAAKNGSENSDSELPKAFPVTVRLETNVLAALASMVHIPPKTSPPCWLIDGKPFPAEDTIGTSAGIVNLPLFADGAPNAIQPKTPTFFNLAAIRIAVTNRSAPRDRWVRFLREIWADDEESIETLQDWFGYLLASNNKLQKILMLIGPKRSGKGTICRILEAMLGPSNVCNPSLASLSGPFGLQGLVGKTLATITDARTSARMDIATAAENLLKISGEDSTEISRKHIDPINIKLTTRFMIVSNELPTLPDSSMAITSRMVVLSMSKSFEGEENTNLTDELMEELPGIFAWAVVGWKRIRDRKTFIQPASGLHLLSELREITSPIGQFVNERCEITAGATVPVQALYREYQSWCEVTGREHPGNLQSFGKSLLAAVPGIRKPEQKRVPGGGGVRDRFYIGIRISADRLIDQIPEVAIPEILDSHRNAILRQLASHELPGMN